MKTLYFDCSMGAAGDMLCAALLELFPNPEKWVDCLNALGIPHVHYEIEPSVKCGITGTHLRVKVHDMEEEVPPVKPDGLLRPFHIQGDTSPLAYIHDATHHHTHGHAHTHEHSHTHEHRSLHDITHILEHLSLPEKVHKDVLAVYELLAEAESNAHGVPVSEIHFHEVGNLDAIADITAFCFLLNQLSPNRIYASPIHVGSGQVRCAHGILPVPAPATAYLLQGCPIYGGSIEGELCTPTGAALLKYFVHEFGPMPPMTLTATGYGMGKKDFPAANCVRTMLGESNASKDEIYELNFNLDDMTAEQIGFASERFFQEGALDVFTTSIQMKKNRPGTLMTVLCHPEQKDSMMRCIFMHTSTAGIRESKLTRSILSRSISEVETPYGIIRRKDYSGYGTSHSKYEYDDLASIASANGISIAQVLKNING